MGISWITTHKRKVAVIYSIEPSFTNVINSSKTRKCQEDHVVCQFTCLHDVKLTFIFLLIWIWNRHWIFNVDNFRLIDGFWMRLSVCHLVRSYIYHFRICTAQSLIHLFRCFHALIAENGLLKKMCVDWKSLLLSQLRYKKNSSKSNLNGYETVRNWQFFGILRQSMMTDIIAHRLQIYGYWYEIDRCKFNFSFIINSVASNEPTWKLQLLVNSSLPPGCCGSYATAWVSSLREGIPFIAEWRSKYNKLFRLFVSLSRVDNSKFKKVFARWSQHAALSELDCSMDHQPIYPAGRELAIILNMKGCEKNITLSDVEIDNWVTLRREKKHRLVTANWTKVSMLINTQVT